MGVDGKEKKKRRRDSGVSGESRKKSKSESKKEDVAAPVSAAVPEEVVTKDVVAYLSPIAKPMAGKKLQKKLFKLMGKAAKTKSLRRGIKEVVLALRKDEKGVCLIAGDVYPVDVVAHLPLLCEEAEVPYCYVSRKADLGAAGLTKRPTSVAFVSKKTADEALTSDIKDCAEQVTAIFPETFA